MRLKRVHLALICLLLAVCIVFGLTACGNETEQLSAPQITLSGNVISWQAIEHADSYEIYEADTHVATQSGTSYTINKTVAGIYTFSVKATSSDGKYNTSNNSNTVSYQYAVAQTEQLTAPVVTLAGNVLSWAAVENAVLYEIYLNGSLVTRQIETTYTIQQTTPGTYSYTVKAVSGDEHYTTSNASNVVAYVVNEASDTPVQLAAPVITVDEQSGTVSWNAVEHATGYIVFENNDAVSTQTETTYAITQTLVGTYNYSVIATSLNAAYTTSPRSNIETYTINPTQLATPVVTRDGRLLSWEKVDNADEYEVYENSRRVSIQTENSYVITQTRYGAYSYTVIAKSSSTQYVSSNASEPVEFVLVDNAPLLDAPEITLDNETGIISWNAVENADGYQIFENGILVFATEALSYTITRLNPGTYSYTVRATSDSENYRASEQSNAVEYTVISVETTFTVSVAFPQGYPAQTVTVGLYSDDTLVASAVVVADGSSTGEARIMAMSGYYTVKISSPIPSGYVATQTRISAEIPSTKINIIRLGGNVLNVGRNTVRGTEAGIEQEYVFIATKGGTYSIVADEAVAISIYVSNTLTVYTDQGMTIGTFNADVGEALRITVYYGAAGTASFEIVEGAVKQYLNVGTGNTTKDRANFISNGIQECTRYLTVEQTTTYAFFFTTATINLRIVTITVNGQSYVFDGDENCLQEITIEAGVDIELQFHIDGVDEIEGMHIAFFVYPVD